MKDEYTYDINVTIHLSVIEERIYNGLMRFLCTPRSYFF